MRATAAVIRGNAVGVGWEATVHGLCLRAIVVAAALPLNAAFSMVGTCGNQALKLCKSAMECIQCMKMHIELSDR